MITQRKKGFIVKDIWIEINTGQACKLIESMHGILVSPARNEKIQKECFSKYDLQISCLQLSFSINCHQGIIATDALPRKNMERARKVTQIMYCTSRECK
jgi:hypothetical protein